MKKPVIYGKERNIELMSTYIRPETSERSPYWLERHRYYELKHFCLQYPIWKKAHAALDGLSKWPDDLSIFVNRHDCSDPTARCAVAKAYYSERMEIVERIAVKADPELARYILLGVTEGWSYAALKARFDIPCCKDTYYDRYRRFFWLLNKERS